MDVLELLNMIRNASKKAEKCEKEEAGKEKKKTRKVKVKKEASLLSISKKDVPLKWFTIDTGDRVYTYTISKKSAVEVIEDMLIDLTTKVVTLERLLAPYRKKAAAEDLLNEKHSLEEFKTKVREILEKVGLEPDKLEEAVNEITEYFVSIEPKEEFEAEELEKVYEEPAEEETEGEIADVEVPSDFALGASVKVAKEEKKKDEEGVDLLDLGLDLGLEGEKKEEKKKEEEEVAEETEPEVKEEKGAEEIEVAEIPVDKIKEAIDKGEKSFKIVIKVGSVKREVTIDVEGYSEGKYILREAAEKNPKKWVYDVARKIVYPMPTTGEPVIAREDEKVEKNKRVWGREEAEKADKPEGKVVWARESEKKASLDKKAALVNELVKEMVIKEMLEPERAEIMKDIYYEKASVEELEAKLASVKTLDGSKAFVDEDGEIVLLDNLL